MNVKSIKVILGFFIIIVLTASSFLIKTVFIDKKSTDFYNKQSQMSDRNTLVVGSKSWNGNFNPVFSSTLYDTWATNLIFDNGLMTNNVKGEPQKWMAQNYKISKDGRTYTFNIKKGIKFSNGHEVTAKDFENTYIALADPGYDGLRRDAVINLQGYEEYHDNKAVAFSGIKVIDSYTIQFIEKTPKASALLEDFIYAPLDHLVYKFTKGSVTSIKKLYNNAVGAGPYLLITNKPENYILFKRNNTYWRGTPKIQNIKIILSNSTDEMKRLESGEIAIDGTVQCNYKTVEEIKKFRYLNTSIYPSNSYGYIGLNLRNPKFSDKRVRQALMYGFDRTRFVKGYYREYGIVCNAPVSSISWAYTNNVKPYSYSFQKASELLDEAGWKFKADGFRYKNDEKFTIHWMTYTGSEYMDALIPLLKADYRTLGIDVVVERMQFSTLADKIFQTRNFEMYNMAWGLNIDPDPSGVFSITQDVPGGGNSIGFRNNESEALINEGLRELDQTKRKVIYSKWLSLINDEVPYLFISQGKSMYVYNNHVKGLIVGPYNDWTTGIENIEIK